MKWRAWGGSITLKGYVIGRARGPSLAAQMIKSLSAMQETGVGSLGQEDPLEEDMAMHCSILA